MTGSRDWDIGKRMFEDAMLEAFMDSFPRSTGREIAIVSGGETPDYIALIDGREMGVELTEIRANTPDDYVDEVVRLTLKKDATFARAGAFARPVILVCHSHQPPIYDMRRFLDGSPSWADLTDSGFSEIWLMDLSDEYYSPRDPRKPADLYCLAPAVHRGLHQVERTRKPFG